MVRVNPSGSALRRPNEESPFTGGQDAFLKSSCGVKSGWSGNCLRDHFSAPDSILNKVRLQRNVPGVKPGSISNPLIPQGILQLLNRLRATPASLESPKVWHFETRPTLRTESS